MVAPLARGATTWSAYGLLAFYGFVLNVLGPLMPSLRAELGLSYTLSSAHFSAFAFGMIVAGLTGDRIISRLGRASATRLASLGVAFGAVLLMLGHQPALTLIGVLTMGSLGSLLLIVVPASLSDLHANSRGTALIEANAVASIASFSAPIAVGLMLGVGLGWRAALVPAVVVALVLAASHRAVAPNMRPRTSASAAANRTQHFPSAFWLRWLAIVLVVGVEFCFIYWGADFLRVDGGLNESVAATSVSIFLLTMLLGRFAGSRLAERVGDQPLMLGSLVVAAIGFIAYWAPAMPILVRLTGLGLAGLGVANLYPTALSLAIAVVPDRADAASARALLASGTAILVSPLLLGALADQSGIRVAYLVVPLLLVGAGAVVLFGAGPAKADTTTADRTITDRLGLLRGLPGSSTNR